MAIIPTIIQALAALYVLGVALLALNRMGPSTRHLVRLSYLALAGGAMAAIASSYVARDIFECIFALGVALYMAVDRRKTEVKS